MSRGLHSSITVLLKIVTSDGSYNKMVVPLAFLPKFWLNKILASSALNLSLFSFFLIFILVFYFIYLFLDSLLPVLTLKRKSLCAFACGKNACKIKEF